MVETWMVRDNAYFQEERRQSDSDRFHIQTNFKEVLIIQEAFLRSLRKNEYQQKDTKMVLIEDSSTSMANSELHNLDEKELILVKSLVK